MDQMNTAASGPVVPMEYEGCGGFEVNDMTGPVMAPVGVPDMNSMVPNEVQVNNVAYYPPGENGFNPNNSYYDPQAEEIMKLKENIEFWRRETQFWQLEGNCYSKERDSWKADAASWKAEAEKWKAEANKWKVETVKWKAQADKRHNDYCKSLKQSDTIWHLWKACEDAKVANSHTFQNIFQRLTFERAQKDKLIEEQKKELADEKERSTVLHAELKAQTEVVEQVRNHEKMVVTTLRNKAIAKENELRNKLENQTREYENFSIGANGRVNELAGKVRTLQNQLDHKQSVIDGYNSYCGQIYEEKRVAEVELRKIKDFMTALTCDLQDNLGKFMKKYGLSVAPVLESKWDWRTKEEKCLVSHLRMLVTLTDGTYKDWEENGMLKQKQAAGSDKTAGNAVGAGDGKMATVENRPEKRQMSGCSSDASVAGSSGSSKKWKF